MKIYIVQPTYYLDPSRRRPFKAKKLNLLPLTLPYLAALIPQEHRVMLTDEKTQNVDMDPDCDAVMFTVWTLNSLRAYDLADHFRKTGIPVIMGGPHCFFHHEEVLRHADAVAIGEGEALIPDILSDLNAERLKPVYRADTLADLSGLPLPRRDLLNPKSYTRFHTVAVQTTRGCPNRCEFCAERFYLGSRYRMRPVDEVIEEIKASGIRRIFFVDSTFAGNRRRTLELMEKMIPLKVRWSALWTADRVLDREFMRVAMRSGLLHLNLGIESIKQETLNGMNKRTTRADRLKEVISVLHDFGISYSLNLIFGWDTDTIEDFQRTLTFLKENRVHAAFFNSFSPHKGTAIYQQFMDECRILDDENMNRWPGVYAKIRPKHFTAQQLESELRRMYRQFYSWPSILRRLPLPISMAAWASWAVNMGQRKIAFGKGTNFDNI